MNKKIIIFSIAFLSIGFLIGFFCAEKMYVWYFMPWFENTSGKTDMSIFWTFVGAIGTIAVSIVAVWQTKKANRISDRLLKKEENSERFRVFNILASTRYDSWTSHETVQALNSVNYIFGSFEEVKSYCSDYFSNYHDNNLECKLNLLNSMAKALKINICFDSNDTNGAYHLPDELNDKMVTDYKLYENQVAIIKSLDNVSKRIDNFASDITGNMKKNIDNETTQENIKYIINKLGDIWNENNEENKLKKQTRLEEQYKSKLSDLESSIQKLSETVLLLQRNEKNTELQQEIKE